MRASQAIIGEKQRAQSLHAQLFRLLYTVCSGLLVFFLLCSYSGVLRMSDRLCLEVTVVTALMTVLYCARDLSSRFILLCFNVTFFVFLVGGLWINNMDGGSAASYLGVSGYAATHTVHVLPVSLLTVNTVFILMEKPSRSVLERRKKTADAFRRPEVLPTLTRQIILVIFLVALAGKLMGALIQYRFMQGNNYIESYVTNLNKPIYVWLPESIFYFSLCLWLATNPSKKMFWLLMVPVLITEGIILLSGDRAEPVCALLMLCFYVYRRGKTDEHFFHVRKRHVVLVLTVLPLFIVLLQVVSYVRMHKQVDVDAHMLLEFVEDQGVSAGVIGKAYVVRDSIRAISSSSYTFGSLRGYIKHNMLTRVLFDTAALSNNTIEAALSGDSLGSTLAYLWIPQSYLQGVGCGSSYIAELFHDGGIGVLIFGNGVLAAVLILLTRIFQKEQGTFPMAFALLAFKGIIIVPRTNSFHWLTSVLSAQNLLVLLVLLLITRLIRNRERRETA